MEKNRKEYSKKNIYFIALFFIIFLYFIIKSVPTLISAVSKTVLPEEQLIEDSYMVEAITIKNEEVYKAAGKGNVDFIVDEGERVSSGKKIAQLKLLKDSSTKDQQLEEVNRKIKVLTDTIKEIDEDKEYNSQKKIEHTVKEIQEKLQKKEYESADALKEKLKIYKLNDLDSEEGKSQILNKIEDLKLEQRKIQEEINKNIVNYYSRDAGVVSFRIDGYEEVFKYSDRKEYSFQDLKDKPAKKNLLDNKHFEYNEPIFKIINNFEWYLLIDATKVKDVESYELGNLITIKYKEKEVKGRVENIFKEAGKVNLLCKFNTDFEEFYDKRFLSVEIIRDKNYGFKLPKKAIGEFENQKGVYIRQTSGVVKFKPVEIIKEDSEYIYVSAGDEQGYISVGLEDEKVKTISRFDEVIINNIKMKEGLILD